MRRLVQSTIVAAIVAGGALAAQQAGDVNKVLADARAALGGEKKLAAIKTFTATGRSTKVVDEKSAAPTDFETAFELPDKFMRKDALGMINGSAITRTSGFNADEPINIVDQPPAMPGQIVMFRFGSGAPGTTPTPEQQEQDRKNMLLAAKGDFARLTLGMLVSSTPAYPLEFSYGGQAESPDGKADIVEVKGEGGFAVRMFIDTKMHLPLMLSWMAREPMVRTISMGGPGGGPPPAGSGGGVVQNGGARGQQMQQMTPEERDKMLKQAQEQAKAAEAKLRVVEFRLYYSDYRDVSGIKVPFTLQRSVDGKPTEELALDKVKINEKIDPKKFAVK
jgi:hypothetical protein